MISANNIGKYIRATLNMIDQTQDPDKVEIYFQCIELLLLDREKPYKTRSKPVENPLKSLINQ